MTTIKLTLAVALLAVSAHACAAQQPTAKPASPQVLADSSRKSLVPPGFGTLKQDEFTLGIRSGALLVKVTPLNERVIRLAAPDTYNRLHALAESRRALAVQRTSAKEPELFLVSFFSYQPDVSFSPEDVQLEINGKTLRPAAIFPLSSSWGKQMMAQQETQAAVYAFADVMDYELPLVLRYGMDRNESWQGMIPKLEVERTKILSKQKDN